jgi:alpha-glucosidase
MDLPHHDGSPLHVSTQTPALGDTVRVRVRIPEAFGPVQAVYTRSNPNREPRYTDAVLTVPSTADAGFGWNWWEADVTIENPVHGYRFLIRRADGSLVWLNATGVHETETPDTDDFKLVSFTAPPDWVHDTVLYQLFPDRYARSDAADSRPTPEWAQPAAWNEKVRLEPPARWQQFYGGDLDGAAQHLDHLERLGITTVYLTPVFPARSNHRYDASSFHEVDPLLGGNEALVRFVDAAHSHGMRVIGDLTSNHCGDAHEWFKAAYGHPDAPESEFFYWLNDEHTEYVSWLGVPSLPKFNWNSAELRRRFIEGPDSVVARWLKPPFSLDGWRIDVSNMTGRYLDQDLNETVRRIIRRTMLEVNPDTMLLGESTNDAASDFQGDAWHGAMTYANFTRPLWGWLSQPFSPAGGGLGFALGVTPGYSGADFHLAHTRFVAGFPWRTRLGTMNALDTHDVPRFRTHALPGAVPVALGMAVTFPGIPVVWAGDEFGLTAVDGEESRTPLPWALLTGPADERDEATGVNAELAQETSELYATLITLRRQHGALSRGGMRWLHVDRDVLAYVREDAAESILVVASRREVRLRIPFDSVAGAESARQLFGEATLTVTEPVEEDDGGIRIASASSGPSFTAWQLPGVAAPWARPPMA